MYRSVFSGICVSVMFLLVESKNKKKILIELQQHVFGLLCYGLFVHRWKAIKKVIIVKQHEI